MCNNTEWKSDSFWQILDQGGPATIPDIKYTITATAGSGGAISPCGAISVNQGASQTFTITPYTGYRITDVKVDGTSVGAVSDYIFSNVTANHAIEASFAKVRGREK